jgi:hypothetical protein
LFYIENEDGEEKNAPTRDPIIAVTASKTVEQLISDAALSILELNNVNQISHGVETVSVQNESLVRIGSKRSLSESKDEK